MATQSNVRFLVLLSKVLKIPQFEVAIVAASQDGVLIEFDEAGHSSVMLAYRLERVALLAEVKHFEGHVV